MNTTALPKVLAERETRTRWYTELDGITGWSNLQRTRSAETAHRQFALDFSFALVRAARVAGLANSPATGRWGVA